MRRLHAILFALVFLAPSSARADQVIPDDLIVQGSVCAGADCPNNYNFGFATFALRGTHPRVQFSDTSTGAFPANDWELVANDPDALNGREYFAIRDVTANRTPFYVFAGAPANALVVSSTGRVGFGTANPVMSLHSVFANTPTVRLEQTNAVGFTAWTWDVGGNEANFFVRDVTGGGRLPLRIRPGAPTNSLYIAQDGHIGLGTASPAGALHVVGAPVGPTGNSGGLAVFESNAAGDAILLNLRAQGSVYNVYADTLNGSTWVETYGIDPLGGPGRAWTLGEDGSPTAIAVTHDGNMRIAGTMSTGSSRAIKHDITSVDRADVLARVKTLPLARWRYKNDAAQSTHLGPMAEDFHDAFRLGPDDKHIAPADLAGVAVASVQALADEVEAQHRELTALEKESAELAARLERIEKRLQGGGKTK